MGRSVPAVLFFAAAIGSASAVELVGIPRVVDGDTVQIENTKKHKD